MTARVITDAEAAEIGNLSRVVADRFPGAAVQLNSTSTLTVGVPPDELTEATNAELIDHIAATLDHLNRTMERLAKSNENGEAMAKLNALLQFLAVLLAVVTLMQTKQSEPSRDEPAAPTPTTVTKVVEPRTPGPSPSPRPDAKP